MPEAIIHPVVRRLSLSSTVLVTILLLAALAVARAVEPPAPALPPDVTPLPADLADHLQELLGKAEKHRGLTARRPVASGALSEAVLQKKIAEALREDLSPEELKAVEASLKAFGLIPETMDLATYLPELLSSEVAGFYDPERRYLALVRREGEGNGEEESLEDIVLIHELTHALQDQHFDLARFSAVDPLSDASTAREALVEGDATLTMFSALTGVAVETLAGSERVLGEILRDAEEGEMAAAPAWFRDTLLFSYLEGYAFCLSVKRLGGQKLLDHAYTTDPPLSSEQILHPEKWHTRRDDPIVLPWPDLSRVLPGATKLAEGEMGEAGTATLLRESLGDRERAAAAAAGWGGDRFAVYGRGKKDRLLVWLTEWDREAEAGEFHAAARKLGRGWTVTRATPSRVLLVRGRMKRAERSALTAALAAIQARVPANKPVDVSAFGEPAGPPKTDG